MKRRNNQLRFALVGLSAIALSSVPVRAADFGQLAQVVGGQVALAAPYLTNVGFLGMLAQYFGGAQSVPGVISPDNISDLSYVGNITELYGNATQLSDVSDALVAQAGMSLVEGIGREFFEL